MIELLFIPIALLYVFVVGSLFVFGANFFYLTYLTLRERRHHLALPSLDPFPRVTVQLPIYNELYVAERLINAAASLDYPKDLLQIQVLDDSMDETVEIVRNLVNKLRLQGIDIVHMHRTDRRGFKAGALGIGMSCASGEFLAIFDADFIPPSDFLRRTLPYFQDPRIGFIQSRWGHVNQDYSLLTRLQALAIDAHFMVEQFARSRGGYWFNFNGTAGIWRRKAIQDAGGWTADTLTEDLDLSYRAFLRGWRAIYLRDVEVPAELPVSFSAYRRQQHRWARGSLECALKYIPTIWKTPMPLSLKIEASLHLLGYGVHILMFGLAVLYPLVLALSQHYPNLVSLFGIGIFFTATALAPTIYFIVAQQQLHKRWWQLLPAIFFLTALGAGMMMNTMRAILQIIQNNKGVFERTPKFGIVNRKENWTRRRYQLRMDPIVYFEIFFAMVNVMTGLFALHLHNWAIAFFAFLFSMGLLFTSGLTIMQTLAVARENTRLTKGALIKHGS